MRKSLAFFGRSLLAASLAAAFAQGASAAVTVGSYTEDGRSASPVVDPSGAYRVGSASAGSVEFARGQAFAADGDFEGSVLGQSIRADSDNYTMSAANGAKLTIGSASSDIEISGYGAIMAKLGGNAKIKGASVSLTGNGDSAINSLVRAGVDIEAQSVTLTADTAYGAVHIQNNTSEVAAPANRAYVKINAGSVSITNQHSNGRGVSAFSNGLAELNGNVRIEARYVVDARGLSTVNINQTGSGTTVLLGDISFSTPNTSAGNTQNSGKLVDANVNIGLNGAGSSWTGRAIYMLGSDVHTDLDGNAYNGAVTGLKLDIKNGARWNLTGSSLANNVNLSSGVISLAGAPDGSVINMLRLTGSGTVEVDAGSTSNINLRNASSAAITLATTQTSEEITAEEAAALPGAVFTGAGASNVTVSVPEGMYKGALTIASDGSAAESVNTIVESVSSGGAAALSVNRLLMNDLRKRLGDIRAAGTLPGVWARYDGGRLSGRGVENDFHTVQFGADTVPEGSSVRFGAAGSYTKGDADFNRGGSDMDAFSLAGYGTWSADNGAFADVILRIASVKNSFTMDQTKKGSMKNIALSASGEVGMRFDAGKNFFIEPQAELTYTYVNSDTLELKDRAADSVIARAPAGSWTYRMGSVNSVIGRAGFAAGWECPAKKGNVYVRASVLHEFAGDSRVFNGDGTAVRTDGKDTWAEFGLGANVGLTKNAYLWADIERTEGARLDEDWRAAFGVRYSF